MLYKYFRGSKKNIDKDFFLDYKIIGNIKNLH